MEGIRSRMLEIAEEVAEAFRAEGAQAKVWEGKERGIVRVYVSRELSRGRAQDMGYVEVHPDETISVSAYRRASWMEDVARGALA